MAGWLLSLQPGLILYGVETMAGKEKSKNKEEAKKKNQESPEKDEPKELHIAESADDVEDRLKAEQKELMDKLLRLQADFENYRKRAARERIQIEAHATEELIKDLLPVSDHFEMALKSARDHKTEDSVLEGFQMVQGQLIAAMSKHGLEVIDAKEGEFDPVFHEAVAHVPSGDVPENHIVEQTRKGYKLGDKLIRAAEVVVSSGTPGQQVKD